MRFEEAKRLGIRVTVMPPMNPSWKQKGKERQQQEGTWGSGAFGDQSAGFLLEGGESGAQERPRGSREG